MSTEREGVASVIPNPEGMPHLIASYDQEMAELVDEIRLMGPVCWYDLQEAIHDLGKESATYGFIARLARLALATAVINLDRKREEP